MNDALPAIQDSTRLLIVGASLGLLLVVFYLVRRRSLREEYTPIWIAVSLVAVLLATFKDVLNVLAKAIGASTLSSTVFVCVELFLIAICLNYAVRLSRLTLTTKNLAQKMALLEAEVHAVRAASPAARAPAEEGEG